MKFKLKSRYEPKGDQPKAIKKLYNNLKNNKTKLTLLGATGTGKTFSLAHVIEKYQKPTLVIAHNKTLAAQLYQEFKEYFPNNKVEYFVSYYDYYQPESYVAHKDLYIEKATQINKKIERLRLAATAAITSRRDTIVIASVSCIYGLSDPKDFKKMGFELNVGQEIKREDIINKLIDILFTRNDIALNPGNFSVKGEVIDFVPGYYENIIRIEMFGDEIERILELDKITKEIVSKTDSFFVFPAKQFVIDPNSQEKAIKSIEKELKQRLKELNTLEAQRLNQRTRYDIEMIKESGYCTGIENYSRHFDNRSKGERPYTLLDYFDEDFLMIIDESHQTLPQVRGMYAGDYSRKKNLVDYGFRLPSALDNRPLKFKEFEKFLNKIIYVSATPGDYEINNSFSVIEQIIRPTGLIDPPVDIHPIKGQIKDLIKNIKQTIKNKQRVLVTTLTKKLAEEVSEFLSENNINTRYLHSEIDTLERSEIIRDLRAGEFDVLVGINLLREGLDIPEVSFLAILDADKEGFLRDQRSLIQTIGRAARNKDSKVILYADKITDSIKKAIDETNRRRKKQIAFNKKYNITPKTIVKPIPDKKIEIKDIKNIPKSNIPKIIKKLKKEMKEASNNLEFEKAIALRDKINNLEQRKKSN